MPARQSDLRRSNLTSVLAEVAASTVPPSRAAVASATGLTRTTVSALVELLLVAGLVEEVRPGPRLRAGRPATGLRVSGAHLAALGAEVGVDYLAACVVDLTGTVRGRAVVPGDNRGLPPGEVLARSAALAGSLLAPAAREGLRVVGTAWAVPGLVDAGRGRVLLAPNLGWSDVEVARALGGHPALAGAGALGPPLVDNEATLAALAEPGVGRVPGVASTPGAATGSLLRVSGEVGIGAGLVLDGRLARGRHGWSGELGHVCVDPSGPRCRCGARGCLEVYAGQEAVLAAAGRVGVLPGTTLGESAAPGGAAGPVGLGALAGPARHGEPAALAALARAGWALGVAVSAAVNLLDVDAVVLGGVYAPLAAWVLPTMTAELDVRVLRARLAPVPVRVSTLGPDAAVLGAAASVLATVLEDPGALVGEVVARAG